MRDRAMGILFILSGLCFVAGVVNPPLLSTWGESVPGVIRTASAHRTAWFTSTWLIALSVVAGIAAVELLVRSLDTDAHRRRPAGRGGHPVRAVRRVPRSAAFSPVPGVHRARLRGPGGRSYARVIGTYPRIAPPGRPGLT